MLRMLVQLGLVSIWSTLGRWDWVDLCGEQERERQFRPSAGPGRKRGMRSGYLAGSRRGRIMGVTDRSGFQQRARASDGALKTPRQFESTVHHRFKLEASCVWSQSSAWSRRSSCGRVKLLEFMFIAKASNGCIRKPLGLVRRGCRVAHALR